MCVQCYWGRYSQAVQIEASNITTPRRVITLYHEGFTAAQIADIISYDLEWVEIVIEERA